MIQSRTKTRVISRSVLKALGFAGAVSTALVAPNSLVLIDLYMKGMDRKNARRTINYLKYRNYIEVKEKNGEYYYKLTNKGRDKFEKIIVEELSIKTPKFWDRKWRLVMFDIPADHKASRQQLLSSLRKMNFYMLQQSAWVHPFDCEKQVGILIQYLKIEKYASFIVVEKGNFTDHTEKHYKKLNLLM